MASSCSDCSPSISTTKNPAYRQKKQKIQQAVRSSDSRIKAKELEAPSAAAGRCPLPSGSHQPATRCMVTTGLPVPAPGTVPPLLPRLLEPAAGLLTLVSCAAALAAGRRSPPTSARVTACASRHLRARQRAIPAPVEPQTSQIQAPLGPSRRLGPLTSSLGQATRAGALAPPPLATRATRAWWP